LYDGISVISDILENQIKKNVLGFFSVGRYGRYQFSVSMMGDDLRTKGPNRYCEGLEEEFCSHGQGRTPIDPDAITPGKRSCGNNR
jgi:hypothetical protein